MNLKHIYIMAGVLGALVVLALFTSTEPETRPIEEQIQLKTLTPASLTPDKVVAIELSKDEGKTPEELAKLDPKDRPVVRLERKGDAWAVVSAWNAPAESKKINDFLQTLGKLKGDFVTDNAERHATYKVDEKDGLRVRLFTAQGDKPALDLLVGTKREHNESLVRLAADKTVYVVQPNLRSEIGLWDVDSKPSFEHWLDKGLLRADKEKLRRIDLTYPDHALAFEKVQKPAEQPEGEDGKADDQPEAKPEYEWKLVAGPDYEFKKAGLDNLLTQFANFDAQTVEDPARKKEFGLEEPAYRLMLTFDDGKTLSLTASRDRAENSAKTIVSDKPEYVYVVPGWRFDAIFKAGHEFFELKPPSIETAKARSIRITRGEETLEMTRAAEDQPWALTQPNAGFTFKPDVAKSLLEKLSSWKPRDYTDAQGQVQFGMSVPAAKLEIGLEGGESYSLWQGKQHPGLNAFYVAQNDAGKALVMEKADVEVVFPPRKALFELPQALFKDLKADEIESVKVTPKTGAAVELTRGADGWQVAVDGKPQPADEAKIKPLLQALVGLKGMEILQDSEAAASFPIEGMDAVVFRAGGKENRIEIGGTVDGARRAARIGGWIWPVSLTTGAVNAIFVDPAKLVKPAPAPAPEGAEAPAEATAADAKPAEAAPTAVGAVQEVRKVVPNPFADE